MAILFFVLKNRTFLAFLLREKLEGVTPLRPSLPSPRHGDIKEPQYLLFEQLPVSRVSNDF